MNWTRKEWLAVVVMMAGLMAIWNFFGTTAMFRIGAAGVAFMGLAIFLKGYKAFKHPEARNENWKVKDDMEWGKTAMIVGLVLWVIAVVLALYVPILFNL